MNHPHRCLGESCDRIITYSFAICSECEQKYGNSALDWPDWLRFAWNDLQRQRRRDKKIRDYEVSISDLEPNLDTE